MSGSTSEDDTELLTEPPKLKSKRDRNLSSLERTPTSAPSVLHAAQLGECGEFESQGRRMKVAVEANDCDQGRTHKIHGTALHNVRLPEVNSSHSGNEDAAATLGGSGSKTHPCVTQAQVVGNKDVVQLEESKVEENTTKTKVVDGRDEEIRALKNEIENLKANV